METAGPQKTLDQLRADHAWRVVKDLVDAHVKSVSGKLVPDEQAKKFGTQAKKLPTRIMTSGLGQALAFLEAKKYAPDLLAALADWMNRRRSVQDGDDVRLVVRVIRGDADFQRYATAECLAYLQWLVRFADAQGLTDAVTEG
jgi:CRISPR-associated protein Cmr5